MHDRTSEAEAVESVESMPGCGSNQSLNFKYERRALQRDLKSCWSGFKEEGGVGGLTEDCDGPSPHVLPGRFSGSFADRGEDDTSYRLTTVLFLSDL
ncbi:hypothetical protein EYF80_025026 [Liparis tanakae]|uniref:Uncharacterized protein n=1 Tax=Liparis tanakae TaxID=230148 RepID=A0A4Z2HGR2_9TELE|nr:hypothetical protein EYF80_025026 [Liparis tanakae]